MQRVCIYTPGANLVGRFIYARRQCKTPCFVFYSMNSLYATRATTRSAKARLGSTTTRAAKRVPDHAVPIDPGLLHTLVEAVSTAVDKRLDARDQLLRQTIDAVAANAASVQAAASLAPPSSSSASPRQRGCSPGETFSSGYGLVGQGVCYSLKENIVAGNYIPLRWLRRNHSIDINFDLRTPPKDSSKDVVPVSTLQEWTHLFLLYKAIRLQALPQEGYGVTTCMSHILRIADRAGFPTAAKYDGQFRIQWAERTLPWEIFRGDILFEVEDHIRHQRGTRPFRAGGTGSGAFTRHCFRFNKRGGCTKRSYPYSHRFPSVDGRITVRPHVATPTKRSTRFSMWVTVITRITSRWPT